MIFWQECKHILRSKFFWSVIVLGIALAIFMSWEMGFNLSLIHISEPTRH